jgi:hypothetical protein
MNQDRRETQLEEFVREQIEDRVYEGMYSDGEDVCYDKETVNVELVEELEENDIIPQEISSEVEKDACQIHCEDCHAGKCPPSMCFEYKATFQEKDGLTLTYIVEENNGA